MAQLCSNPHTNQACSNPDASRYVLERQATILRRAMRAILDSDCDSDELKCIAEKSLQDCKDIGRLIRGIKA